MAWIEQHRRADGGLTARVIWRPGCARDATRVWETFGAGSDIRREDATTASRARGLLSFTNRSRRVLTLTSPDVASAVLRNGPIPRTLRIRIEATAAIR